MRADAGRPSGQAPWSEVVVESWEQLLGALHSNDIIPLQRRQGGHRRSPFMFRGMASAAWPLMTSLERLGTEPESVEQPLLRAFRKYAPTGTFSHRSDWERLSVAQHNGLPTRVLDWTVSPLVAAHFATAEQQHSDRDGVIWCVNADRVRDAVLPTEMSGELHDAQAFIYNVPVLDQSFTSLRDFDSIAERFGDVMIFFEPPSLDARIQNQFGVLSAMNGAAKSHDAYLREKSSDLPDLVRRVIIHRRAKPEIRDMLDQNNITERMLFPGLPGLCDWLRRYYGPV